MESAAGELRGDARDEDLTGLPGPVETAYRVAVRDLRCLMRIAIVTVLVLAAGAVSSAAQNAATFPWQPGLVSHTPLSTCPIDMRVRQGIGSKMMAVDKHGAQVEMFAARLELLLKDLRPDRPAQQMVQASVTVHGLNGAEQMVPADTHRGGSAEAVRTLTVRLTPGGEPEVSGDLRLPGFTATLMVDLESVTYDDGTVMKFSGSSACHAPPDMLMPVGGS